MKHLELQRNVRLDLIKKEAIDTIARMVDRAGGRLGLGAFEIPVNWSYSRDGKFTLDSLETEKDSEGNSLLAARVKSDEDKTVLYGNQIPLELVYNICRHFKI